jgi:hypothetical protein
LAARGFSRRTIQAANVAIISPCPRSPNITANRNGNVIIVYGAGKQTSYVRSLHYLRTVWLPLPVNSLIILTEPTQPTKHTWGTVAAGCDKWQLTNKIKTLYTETFTEQWHLHTSTAVQFNSPHSNHSVSTCFIRVSQDVIISWLLPWTLLRWSL